MAKPPGALDIVSNSIVALPGALFKENIKHFRGIRNRKEAAG
jgi:hypothetical protein